MPDLLIVHRTTQPSLPSNLVGPDNRLLIEHEVSGLFAIYWPTVEVPRAVEVSRMESGFWTGAWRYTGEDSRGLLQLNILAHPEMGTWNLFDPQINAYFGYHLWLQLGWGPWTAAHKLGYV